jgi:glycosyltransferase involved in cell wall biosynthesis
MRLFQAMAGAAVGGAETYFVNLTLALARAGFESHAAIRRHPQRVEALAAGGVAVTELRFGGALDLATKWRLRRALRAFRPDVAVSWMSRASAAMPKGRWPLIGRLGGYYPLKNFRRCDRLVCNTRDLVRHCVEAGWPAERVHHIPNFVAPRRLAPLDRALFDTPRDAPLLLALGRLHRVKGFDVLLHALALLPDAWLWLAGEGEERAALQRLAGELGVAERVRFLGWRDDREALYGAADLCIVASRVEPFGNVILDAWAAGVPLVAAASAGPAEIVSHGENGLLVPVEDNRALAEAAHAVLHDPSLRAQLAAGGLRAWGRDYTEAAAVSAWRRLFEDVTR